MSLARADRVVAQLPIVVFAALPVVGLVAGPSFAGLIFGLGVVQFLYRTAAHRLWPEFDLVLLGLALAFAALAWFSAAWSIVPDKSLHGALQVTGIFAGSLVMLSGPPPSEEVADAIARAMRFAFVLGAVMILTDAATGYHFESALSAGSMLPTTKYNRGADYLVLVGWPILARAAMRREWTTIGLVVAAEAAILASAMSITARIAAVLGVIVLGVALIAPRLAARGLTVAAVAIALFAPALLRFLAVHRAAIAAHVLVTPHLYQSGLHRLEIWDYMTARVFERPLLGWGMWSAKSVPIRPNELSHYLFANAAGIYAHNQWLGLWVDSGAAGASLALMFVLVVLARTARYRPPEMRAFARAALASALTISFANYEITTDSWWAALIASAWLFRALGYAYGGTAREPSSEAARGRAI